MTQEEALQLLIRFAVTPNSQRFCGETTAALVFRTALSNLNAKIKYFTGSGTYKALASELGKFKTLHPYLVTIADATNRLTLDQEVIEAYILGNNLLKNTLQKDYKRLIEAFKHQGAAPEVLERMRSVQMKRLILFHLFQLIHLSPVQDAHKPSVDAINNCMVRWGKVLFVNGESAKLRLYSLKENEYAPGYKLALKPVEVSINNGITPKISVDDTVAVHWETIIKVLTPQEENNLTYWTNEVLKLRTL